MSGLNLLDDNQEMQNSHETNGDSQNNINNNTNNTAENNNSKHLSIEEIKHRIPFKNVYFTGIIRDELGRKMSKSLGNSPDPLHLIDRFGADGVRLGLMLMAPEGQDILFSEERLSQGKKLCTKLWNSVRFRQMRGDVAGNESLEKICERITPKELDITDYAILGELISTMYQYQSAMDAYEFNRAAQLMYNFFWGYYCDWYIEVSKSRNSKTSLAVNDLVLRYILQLLFPFIPFITEELWHAQNYSKDFLENELLLSANELSKLLEKYNIKLSEDQRAEVNKIRDLVSALRAHKAQFGLAAVKNLKFYYQADEKFEHKIKEYKKTIQHLLQTEHFEETKISLQMSVCVTDIANIYMDISGERNVDDERKRMIDEMGYLMEMIELNRKKLSNENFVKRAPIEVVEGARKLLKENEDKYKQLEIALNSISIL
jgi:valyl-tRNA synthetase